MFILYLFEFIIAFPCIRRQKMIDKLAKKPAPIIREGLLSWGTPIIYAKDYFQWERLS